jgi:hypothetical protein
MHSTASSPLPRLDTTRSYWIRHVPGLASLASLASSASHDSCMAMRSDAVRCKPDEPAMTQAMTQAWDAGDHSDASGRAACCATTSPTFAHVAFLTTVGNQRPTIVPWPTRANVAHPPSPRSRFLPDDLGNVRSVGTGPRLERVCFACPIFSKE